jgi:hypothetical protein
MAGKRKGSWQPNPLYHPEIERRERDMELMHGFRFLARPQFIWVEDEPGGDAGRPLSLTDSQIRDGQALLKNKLQDEPGVFVTKGAAIQWLRKPKQGLRINPTISDTTVRRHIVDPLVPKRRKKRQTK